MPDQQSHMEAVDGGGEESIDLNVFEGTPIDEDGAIFNPQTLNRVWDAIAGSFVSWETEGADTLGAQYPGPGTFGVDTSDFVVERLP